MKHLSTSPRESLVQALTSMKYIKVHWIHDFADEPEMLYSEIDSHDNEVRKVEVFKDGSMGYAKEASVIALNLLNAKCRR